MTDLIVPYAGWLNVLLDSDVRGISSLLSPHHSFKVFNLVKHFPLYRTHP